MRHVQHRRAPRGPLRATLLVVFVLLSSAAVPAQNPNTNIRISPDLEVADAVLGYVDRNGDIVAADRIDTKLHQGFAWRLELKGRQRSVSFREEFVLPAPARVWQVGPTTTVAPDRASAVTTGNVMLDSSMSLRNGWVHSPGDPKGAHVIKVSVDGVLVREFHFTLY